MASEHNIKATHKRLEQLGGGTQRKSTEDSTYEISDHAPRTPFTVPSQPHSRRVKLKTYASSNLRHTTTITSITGEQQSRDGTSLSSNSHLGHDTSLRQIAPTANMTVDDQNDAQSAPTPLKDNTTVTNQKMLGTRCTISKEDLQKAMAVTPVARRNPRRRAPAGLPRRPSIWPARTPKNRFQEPAEQSQETRIASEVMQTVPEGDSQGSASSEESVTLEESLRSAQRPDYQQGELKAAVRSDESTGNIQQHMSQRWDSETPESSQESVDMVEKETEVQQNPRLLPDSQPIINFLGASPARGADLLTTLEEDHESEESAGPNGNDEQHDEEQDLNEMEREILHLGEVDAETAQGHSQTGSNGSSPPSPKRRRPSPNHDSADDFHIHNEIEEAEEEEVGQPSPAKRRRTNRKNLKAQAHEAVMQEHKGRRGSKDTQRTSTKSETKPKKSSQPREKKARNVPVEELVMVSERPGNLDAEASEEEDPAELPDDPISQLEVSVEDSYTNANGKKSVHKVKVTLRPKSGFGPIDLSDFRMPEVRSGADRGPHNHSDGFVGREADPIGKTMPVKTRSGPKQMRNKIMLRMGELTLTNERYEDVQEPSARTRKKKVKKPVRSNQADGMEGHPQNNRDAEIVDQGDPMLVDAADEQPVLGDDVGEGQPQQSHPTPEQITPRVSPIETSVLQPPTRSSPLQQKEQRNRTVSFKEDTITHASQAASTQSRGPFGRHQSNEASVSQQLKMMSASKSVVKPKEKELDVLLQLMMVSIPRSSVDYNSDDGDSERNSEEEYNRSSDEDDEDRSDTPEADSGEEDDEESEVEVDLEDVYTIKRDRVRPGHPEAPHHVDPPSLSLVEDQAMPVPTLRREDAQNPILNMSAKQMPTRRDQEALAKSTSRRRSSRRHQQQATQHHQHGDDDDSWRPREPLTSSVLMEVENDDIIDPPTPLYEPGKASAVGRKLSRQFSRTASHALQIVETRPEDLEQPLRTSEESQGSVELGNSQVLLRGPPRAYVPETQFSESDLVMEDRDEEEEYEEPAKPSSQEACIPESSYFQRASQNLHEPGRRPIVVRTKSMPAAMHYPRAQAERQPMAGGITMSAAFQHTISTPSRSKSNVGIRGTLLTATPGTEKTLKQLARQASIGLGTVPSGRKRLVSLPFQPPFKKQ